MTQTRSSRYWDKRAIARLTEAERNSEWHFREIKILYEEAEKDTVASLKAIYESFYRENKFNMTALNKIVPTAEVEKQQEERADEQHDEHTAPEGRQRQQCPQMPGKISAAQ